MICTREATKEDIPAILTIMNEGIQDRVATLDTDEKDMAFMIKWFNEHDERSPILVAENRGTIVGWASLKPYSYRYAYRAVADLSIYISRRDRGKGIGKLLLSAIESAARNVKLHKIVLVTLPHNMQAHKLYRNTGYNEVGVMKEQGIMDGKNLNIIIEVIERKMV